MTILKSLAKFFSKYTNGDVASLRAEEYKGPSLSIMSETIYLERYFTNNNTLSNYTFHTGDTTDSFKRRIWASCFIH